MANIDRTLTHNCAQRIAHTIGDEKTLIGQVKSSSHDCWRLHLYRGAEAFHDQPQQLIEVFSVQEAKELDNPIT